MDQDGVPDLLVGALQDPCILPLSFTDLCLLSIIIWTDRRLIDDDPREKAYLGVVYLMNLNRNGSVKGTPQQISNSTGNLGQTLTVFEFFGSSACSIRDLNLDGVSDLTIGAVESQFFFSSPFFL